jgi:hypothetical protein
MLSRIIKELVYSLGNRARGFSYLASLGVDHFKGFFEELE